MFALRTTWGQGCLRPRPRAALRVQQCGILLAGAPGMVPVGGVTRSVGMWLRVCSRSPHCFSCVCADKPVLLAGLLLVYGLHQHCCVRRDEGADGFLSSQVLSMASTDTGVMLLCLVLLSFAAVADAVIEVESEVREQERLRIQ